ncbi:MAG TPA: ABC transporter permease subunit, partial [Candidatus Limnocylindria bacterium]|nr:ABC transporter permease subunit [Candidatus Limnocylindria bacterium]
MSRRDPWSFIGLLAFFILLFVALFGERIAPHEAIYFVPEHGRDPRPYDPGLVYPFGSDVLGRDLVSLVLAGARLTLGIVVLGGLARVLAALLLAVIASLSARARAALDATSEIVAAVPATLVVLLVVLVFVHGDTTALVFVGALLVTGWAGPYRVLRAELDRLARVAFTEGAAAVGAGRLRIVLRHHVPHVVPLLAMNASQQVVASLVALAELGVLGVFVGTTRLVNIEESLSVVRSGERNFAFIADPPEWGGLLANARDTESLWTTRWVFLIPGLAFAVAAVAVAAIGVAVARRYARRDVVAELRGRGARVLLFGVLALVVAANVVPERYAEARSWAADARASVRGSTGDAAAVFADAGLAPIGPGYTVERDVAAIRATGPATVQVGAATVRESSTGPLDVLPLLYADSGGGTLNAPLVYASWGLSPADFRTPPPSIFDPPAIGKTIADWPDDYANVDVRGKVVVVLRVMGIVTGTRQMSGPDPETSIANALRRGAAGVLFVDPALPQLPRVQTSRSTNLYLRLMANSPIQTVVGRPVIVLSLSAADRLLAPAGIAPSEDYAALESRMIPTDGERATRSVARALDMNARIDVPTELSRA